MKYVEAPDLQRISEEISHLLFPHVKIDRVKCFRSYGSSSKNTIARCHTIGKLMQKAIGVPAYYAIEFLERFDKQSEEDKIKTIIHELMHIPQTFGGGFRHHDWVCEENVNKMYKSYIAFKKKDEMGEVLDEENKLSERQIPSYKKVVEKNEKKFDIRRWF